MADIVAAHVGTEERAQAVQAALLQLGLTPQDVEVFDLMDAGRHARFPIGGDRDSDPAARDSGRGAAMGAATGAAVGAAAGAVAAVAVPALAPAIIAGAAGAGAFGGALAGAMNGTDEMPTQTSTPPGAAGTRRGGLMIAVRIAAVDRGAVIASLRRHGADHIEQAQGRWRDGHWIDFDPLRAPDWIDAPALRRIEPPAH